LPTPPGRCQTSRRSWSKVTIWATSSVRPTNVGSGGCWRARALFVRQ
jgi:hypothetical protein